ncbi:MAG: DUF4404 family protein [Chromatiales bacterium]|nr:DUF4404 family protein [Chromatiales bacterium]
MPREKLKSLLGELRTELDEADALDEESRTALRRLAGRIDQLTEPVSPKPEEHETSPLEQLRDSGQRLQARHPRIAQLLGQIGDTLGKLGI